MWAKSPDLKDAYFNIPIRPKLRKVLCFQYNDILYEFVVLLFRFSTFPQVFTHIVKTIGAALWM